MRILFILFILFFCLFGMMSFWALFQERTLLEQRLILSRKEGRKNLEIFLEREWDNFLREAHKKLSSPSGLKRDFPWIEFVFQWTAEGRPLSPPPLKERFPPPTLRDYKKYGQFLLEMDLAQKYYIEERNYKKGEEFLERILKNYSEPYVANGLNALGFCKMKLKKFSEGREIYQKILRGYLNTRHSSGIPVCFYAYFQFQDSLLREGKTSPALEEALSFQDLLLRNPWELPPYEVGPFLRQNEKMLRRLSPSQKQMAKLALSRWIHRIKTRFGNRPGGRFFIQERILAFPDSTWGLLIRERDFFTKGLKAPLQDFSKSRKIQIFWERERESSDSPRTYTALGNFPRWKCSLSLTAEKEERDVLWRRTVAWIGALGVSGLFLLISLRMAYQTWKRDVKLLELKSEFLNTVSHELKTPLTSISLFAEMLEEKDLPAGERVEYGKIIGQETRRLERLIANILTFSKFRAGRLTLNCDYHSLEEIVDYCCHVSQELIGERKVEKNLPEEVVVLCDRDGLVQLLLNLFSNAAKYTSEKDTIELTGKFWGKDQVEIFFEDTGRGISPKDREKIFEKYYRGSYYQPKDGVGLGLMIAQTLAREMGGELKLLDSDKGARFSLRLKGKGI